MNKDKVIAYYDEAVKGSDNRFKQVHKTQFGEPVGPEVIEIIANTVLDKLAITKEDTVVELGSGNGLVAEAICASCQRLYGIELNENLLAVALKTIPANIEYFPGDILVFENDIIKNAKCFLYEVLQLLTYQDLRILLQHVMSGLQAKSLFIGGVPDINKLFNFYNTEENRAFYYRCIERGDSPMGTWWDRGFIEFVAGDLGLRAEVSEQSPELYTHHYRFDVLITRYE